MKVTRRRMVEGLPQTIETKKKKSEPEVIAVPVMPNDITTSSQLIITNDGAYAMTDWKDCDYPDKSHAYVDGDYFYLFKGHIDNNPKNSPGIYVDDDDIPFIIKVSNDKDKEEYLVKTHLANLSTDNIINVLKVNGNIYYNFPETSKLFIPDITEKDDILKRCSKLVYKAKNIDIDSCKENFIDKNALFNYKQVIKGEARLSILLFERGLDALNLKYTIIVEEIDPDNPIGTSLNDPEAMTNLIKNSYNGEMIDGNVDVTKLPNKFKNNFRTGNLDMSGKIIISSTDTYDLVGDIPA